MFTACVARTSQMHRAALRYEIAISIDAVRIVWVSGHWAAGSNSDMKIFETGLLHKLGKGEFVLADAGYGGTKCVPPPLPAHPMSRKFAMLRARHEAVNGRLKKFRVGICMGSAFLRLSTSFLLSWISALIFQSDPVAKSNFNEVLTAFANYSTSSYFFDSALEPKLHPNARACIF